MRDEPIDWRDICETCETVLRMPPDGSVPYHSCPSAVFPSLTGKTILRAFIDPAHTVLVLELSTGEHIALHTEGDCCSRSWIENVSNVDSLKGGIVTRSTTVEMGEITDTYPEGEAPDACVRQYSAKIHIKGRPAFELEFRNSSNGYYGGSIQEGPFDVGMTMTELGEDF